MASRYSHTALLLCTTWQPHSPCLPFLPTHLQGLAVGQPVATMMYGGFADWAVVAAKHAFAVPAVAPEMVALMTSGLTASIALEQAGLVRERSLV